MRSLLLLSILSFAAACTSRQQLPPGDALEDEREEGASGGPESLPPPPPPDEQERKFAEELDKRDEAPVVKKEEQKQQALTLAPVEPPRRRPADEAEVQANEVADSALANAKRALSRGDTAAVAQELESVQKVLDDAAPDKQQKFFELSFLVNLKTLDGDLAEKAGWSWLRSCGPQSVDSCRSKALSMMGKIPKPSSALQKRLASVKEHDACVKLAESKRNGDRPPPCADSASAFYKRDGDRLMLARLKLANAISSASKTPPPDNAAHLLEQAEKVCDDKRCVALRRNADKWLMRLHRAKDDPEGVARVAIHDSKLYATTLPPDKRLWARTPELEQACAAFDKKVAPGACRRLEREVAGDYTFRDYSVKQERGEGLSPDLVREVNTHYAVTLEGCLQEAAHRLTPPASETHGVRWTVGNDGRVTQVELTRKEADTGPLGQCLREQFNVWRYPRYRGELQHVEQNFIVTARERR